MAPKAEKRSYRVVSGIGAGAGAALAAIILMALLRLLLGVPTIPELLLSPLLRLMGGQNFSNALDTLYYAGRPLMFAMILEGMLVLGALMGLLYAWLGRPHYLTSHRVAIFYSPLGGVLYGLGVGLLLNLVFLPIIGEPPFSSRAREIYSNSPIPLWAGLMVLALLFGLFLHILMPKVAPPTLVVPPSTGEIGGKDESLDRRQFVRLAGGGFLAALGGIAIFGAGTYINQGGGFESPVDRKAVESAGDGSESDVAQASNIEPTATPTKPRPTNTTQPTPTNTPQPPTPTPEQATPTTQAATETPTPTPEPPTPIDTATPEPTSTPVPAPTTVPVITVQEITPTNVFYHVSKNFFDPNPSADGWSLSILGLVGKPYSLSYSELTSLPALEVITGMMCISNPVGGGLIGNARWKGVRLADLLQTAQPKKGATELLISAIDGYTDSITLQKALDPDVMLVWEMNGATLTSDHGFPARLLVPGIYGMKHVKWIQSIELINYDYKGFWQQPDQGWSDPAVVNTMSRIDFPAPGSIALKKQTISGIAFAGDRSISQVEVSTDGGQSWNVAYLKPPLSGTSWAVWAYEWTPPGPGKHVVQVRATDGQGNLQTARRAAPYPNGATGYHSVTYRIAG